MYNNLAKTLFVGKSVVYLPSCHSTNDVASELQKEKPVFDGTLIITDQQLKGKGQRGNSWLTEPGKNLTFTIVLNPRFVSAARQFDLNMAVSIGIVEALHHFHPDFQIKWPNDIYFGEKKIGGILIQNTVKSGYIESSIVGIGINVNQEFFTVDKATSLWQITGNTHDLPDVLEQLCMSIEKYYLRLKNEGKNALKDEYLNQLLGYQRTRWYRSEFKFQGTICGVSEQGRLQIIRDKSIEEYDFKEVEFLH